VIEAEGSSATDLTDLTDLKELGLRYRWRETGFFHHPIWLQPADSVNKPGF
jgi:hypothetical protein